MKPPLRVTFIHLDLGIGGAEQLVLQLATASQDLGYDVDLVTTRCDQDHCFASVKNPEGRLSKNVYIYGNWIPPTLFGKATAFMSTLRMLYLTYQVTKIHSKADVVVVDVLPTSIPLLLSSRAGILFYCHFPDKLLLRNLGGMAKQVYRKLLDHLEESTMGLADSLVVNSKFTLGQVQQHFPTLSEKQIGVLYPALDTTNMVQSNQQPKTTMSPIVSLNRFERKKNIELLLHAYAYIIQQTPAEQQSSLPPLIVAGGYDTRNVENVEYRGELQRLMQELNIKVDFRMDISDAERATLFQTALCVAYTPDKEHFGIVPLEAMYAGTPVLAVNSGGPTETVVDGITGFLRDPTPESFGDALLELINDLTKATTMGRVGRMHVEQSFGTQRFETEWKVLVEETHRLRQTRNNSSNDNSSRLVLWKNTTVYLVESFLALLVCVIITWIFRWMGILGPTQSIFGAFRAGLWGEEL
jgi:glycosyltransferase involved in cell wall biosynthesis